MKLEIEIDDPSHCYCPGQTVRGHLLIFSTSGSNIKAVTIKCISRASTKWMAHHGTSHQRCSERLIYFTAVQQHKTRHIPIGPTSIPFTFQLPTAGTPSSFNGKYGRVVYFVEAVVERPWKINMEARQYFSFNAMVDLNTFPGANAPIQLYKEKTSFSFFCGRGLISAKLNFPRSGYVGGQPLDFMLEIRNFSARKIPVVTLALMQKCTFKIKRRIKDRERKYETRVLNIGFPEGVPPGDERLFTGEKYTIPPLPPTGLGGCPIIDVEYYFQVEMEVFAEAPIRETVPVIIGTIPLRDVFANLSTTQTTIAANGTATAPALSDIEGSTPAAPAPAPGYFGNGLYPDLPPPSYQEAIMGDGYEKSGYNDDNENSIPSAPSVTDLDDDDESGSYFVPKYTMYEWRR